ncbi:MAG: fused MFS/spermidine synthase [Syntrophales bacterium]
MAVPSLGASLPALFSLTLFVSAALLFFVELMIAKLILPLLGGTPAVWNTCVLFYQAVLLMGYGYAHIAGTRAGDARQAALHLAILAAASFVLPIAIPGQWAPAAEGSPVGELLLLLAITVGPPFFVLSATAPLLQRWFARTGHPSAGDPYFLYSASNLGSMVALIGYPLWVEPHLRLAEQSWLWSVGYGVIVLLTALCAGALWRYRSSCPAGVRPEGGGAAEGCVSGPPPTRGERGRWVLYAFVPSSLMLGVTTFLSTDVAAIPLFWVIPLALYLLSFIIVFARVPALLHRMAILLLPLALLALFFVDFADTDAPKWTAFSVHLVNFFLVCMVCHGEIARRRPAAEYLTEFYLWLSAGGVLGGVFNSLLAPVAFRTVSEYPLVLILAALLLPAGLGARPPAGRSWKGDLLFIGTPLLLVPLTHFLTGNSSVASDLYSRLPQLHVTGSTFRTLLGYGVPALICYGLVFLRKPLLFGLGFAALFATVAVAKDLNRDIVHRERSFFGVLTVTRTMSGTFMSLSHGTTLHGKQWLNPETRSEPVSYYHREGPVGEVFSRLAEEKRIHRIAVTGLGTGSLAAYAAAGQEIDFYEIDPAVKRISTDPAYFTFLSDCRAAWRVILGDARLTLGRAPPRHYDIIILDAFSSDSIPVHLLTEEALALYLTKLARDGVLLIHITNRYVNLAPVLARLCAEGGFACRLRDDEQDYEIGKDGSTWVLLARSERDLASLSARDAWQRIEPQDGIAAWRDDFSNILSVFKW